MQDIKSYYKKNGYYYLVIAEGGTGLNHAVMVAVSNNRTVVEDVLRKAVIWVEINRPDMFVVSADIEWR